MIQWFAKNHVTANLVMIVLLLGGLLMLPGIGKEVFPRATLDVITVRVPYPSASPEEVEQGVVRAIEEEVRALEGVKEVRSVSSEGMATVNVELILGQNRNALLNDVESAINRITSFPENAEEPTVSLLSNRRQVISIIYSGDQSRDTLRRLAERAREELLDRDAITYVELDGILPREISIEISREQLRRHRLSLTTVAERVRASSIDLPAGELETDSGEIVLRTTEREETAEGFSEVLLVTKPDGTQVRLGDVATIRDTFRDSDQAAFFDGRPAVRVDVYRVGDETPLEIAEATRSFVETQRQKLPEGIRVATWNDQSQIYEDRMRLLMKNGYLGLALVLLLLALFLEPRLAFWVTLGIPVSFLGALLVLPATDITINLISLFAFIIALGLVVDDAIVVGEAIHTKRQQGLPRLQAAIEGAREVARPVLFSITTSCIAFTPMLFVPGVAGQFFKNIPIVVILVLGASLVESLLVLPSHLSRPMPRLLSFFLRPFLWAMKFLRSERVGEALNRFVERRYEPFARGALRFRYTTLAVGMLLLLLTVGLQVGGRLGFRFLPRIEDDQVSATLEMPVGTPFEKTKETQDKLVQAARRVVEETDPSMLQGIYSDVGVLRTSSPTSAAPSRTGSHVSSVMVDLVSAGERSMRSSTFVEKWREKVGEIPEAKLLSFSYSTGATAGAPINIELSHPDIDTLEAAASELARGLRRYEGAVDVDPGFSQGKDRIDMQLTPEGRAAGLSDAWLAREVRGMFYGAETQRFQRGRDEVRVFVRLPKSERTSLEDLRDVTLVSPSAHEIPLLRAVDLSWGRAYTQIERTNLQRTLNVTARTQGDVTANEIVASANATVLKDLKKKHPELRSRPGGEQQSQQESIESLKSGFSLALIVMYGLLAAAFRSYFQPLIVLCAIPFGAVGAVIGHLVLGLTLSLSSLFGLVALSGVVVNDALLLVTAINERYRAQAEESEGPLDRKRLLAVVLDGSKRRFRPVLMTSLTTFGGLAPMMFETSVQAKFLIPMALSLGFGILFATPVLLLLVPAAYLILEDLKRLSTRASNRLFVASDEEQSELSGAS